MRWPKYWSFSLTIIPSKEHPGLISFRMDWLDFLAVQGTLKSLLQHQSSKASILQRSTFFTVQLSHSYMTTGETIALTRWTFVGKVMSLLLNMLSRLVVTFLYCISVSLHTFQKPVMSFALLETWPFFSLWSVSSFFFITIFFIADTCNPHLVLSTIPRTSHIISFNPIK